VLVEKVDDEAAAGDHLPAIAPDQTQRALHQLGCDAAAAQRTRRLGVGDDHCRRRQPVVGEGDLLADIELEAVFVPVVAYRCRHADPSHSSLHALI
jgi:hypothetical protein